MPGLFLIFVGTIAFGTVTLEKAQDLCAGQDHIKKSCIVEAVQPIKSANHKNYNQ